MNLIDFPQPKIMKSCNTFESQSKKHRSIPTFLKKTYEMLSDSNNYDSVRWASSGYGFLIVNEQLFAKTVLPKYFKHNNYSSFVRQLNMYNFHKIRENSHQSYFHHDFFRCYDKNSLLDIKRKPEKKKKNYPGFQDSEHSYEKQNKTSKVKNPKSQVTTYEQSVISVKEIYNKGGSLSSQKVVSQKMTENIFQQQQYAPLIRFDSIESSDNLSVLIEEQSRQFKRNRVPLIGTKEFMMPSKNNILPMSADVFQGSIMNIFI